MHPATSLPSARVCKSMLLRLRAACVMAVAATQYSVLPWAALQLAGYSALY